MLGKGKTILITCHKGADGMKFRITMEETTKVRRGIRTEKTKHKITKV